MKSHTVKRIILIAYAISFVCAVVFVIGKYSKIIGWLLLLVLFAILRLSPIIIGAAVICVKRNKDAAKQQPVVPERSCTDEKTLDGRITETLNPIFGSVIWSWLDSYQKRICQSGGAAWISLNNANGHTSAQVQVLENGKLKVSFVPQQEKKQQPAHVPAPAPAPAPKARKPVNYELLSYEWVDEHLGELIGKLNEIIGEGGNSMLIPESELPVRDAWEAVCREIGNNGIVAECCDEGITITLLQRQKGE